MYWFRIEQTLQPTEREPAAGECAAVLLSSAELERKPALSGLESVLHHTPTARDVRVCKAELRRDCVSGTLLIPQSWKDGRALACGYLITNNRVVLVDDTGALLSHLRHIAKEKRWTDGNIGRFVYAFLEQLMAKDLHHLEEIEDRIEELEERVLAGEDVTAKPAPSAESQKLTVAQSTCTEAEKRADAYLCQDAITMEKHVSALYDTTVFESVQPALRDVLGAIQKEEQNHGQQFYEYLSINNLTGIM